MRNLVIAVMKLHEDDSKSTVDELIERWLGVRSPLAKRWFNTITEMQGAQSCDFAMFSVALKEIEDLAGAINRCTLAYNPAKGEGGA